MQISFDDKSPIYRQLADRLRELVLEGVYQDGDALPSVRQIAGEHRINPITVSKAFQMLVDEGVVEKRRGLGMFVMPGASEQLAENEKKEFLNEEWPKIRQKIDRLGISTTELLEQTS